MRRNELGVTLHPRLRVGKIYIKHKCKHKHRHNQHCANTPGQDGGVNLPFRVLLTSLFSCMSAPYSKKTA